MDLNAHWALHIDALSRSVCRLKKRTVSKNTPALSAFHEVVPGLGHSVALITFIIHVVVYCIAVISVGC